ncbi:MAG TPA: molybdate ABC transporter substrate-binding protein [Thermoanaerobaculia bacterium]|nr:molybdate ABC transporter substrate-binding protein [Thermoanaerobaculia bacterium]
MKRILLPLFLLGLGFTLLAPSAVAVELNVSAAASLTDAIQDIAHDYEATSTDKILLNLAASSLLSRQIEEGAPADLFLSADEEKMDSLQKQRLILVDTRQSVLGNTLVIVVPIESRLKISGPADLESPLIRAIALAEPQTVPAGIYAKEYLKKFGMWSKVIDRVVPTENVRTALSAVESGNVDLGIVYKTDAEISKNVRVAYSVPLDVGPKISYPFAVVAASKHLAEARKFFAYLTSKPALDVFRRYGFLVLTGSGATP